MGCISNNTVDSLSKLIFNSIYFALVKKWVSGLLCSVWGFPVQESYQQAKVSSSETHCDDYGKAYDEAPKTELV